MGAIHCLSANAMPLPALAYDYQHPEDDDEPEQQISSSPQHMIESSLVNNTTSSRLRSSSLRGGGPSVTTMDGRINDHTSHGHPKSGGGGPGGPGGPGRHRCPRCESEVVFHSSDFNENSFYCAACSGWFVVQDHFASSGAGQASGAGPGQSLNKPSRNQILMQHIADLDDQIHAARRDPTNTFPRDRFARGRQNPQTRHSDTHSNGEEAYDEQRGPGAGIGQPVEPRRLPTPQEIFSGLNEYVIGQHNVKVALSVGVHNHYKRISVAEAQRAAEERTRAVMDSDGTGMPHSHDLQTEGFSDLNLSQFGRAEVETSMSEGGSEFVGADSPDINSIASTKDGVDASSSAGRAVENCELDKSNITIIGPTGSGKTLLVKTLAKLIDVPLGTFCPFFKNVYAWSPLSSSSFISPAATNVISSVHVCPLPCFPFSDR